MIILAVIFLLFFGVLRFLNSYTGHGNFVEVPDFSGKRLRELPQFVQTSHVGYEIIDSIYDPQLKPGMVLRQDPEPGAHVKHNRKVYLYVTGMVPPQVAMPKLIDRSERQARLILETYGLRLGHVEYKEADCNGCVLDQKYKGRDIAPGAAVKKGSVVEIVVGTKEPLSTMRDSTSTDEQSL